MDQLFSWVLPVPARTARGTEVPPRPLGKAAQEGLLPAEAAGTAGEGTEA